jgi:hypothetical protein
MQIEESKPRETKEAQISPEILGVRFCEKKYTPIVEVMVEIEMKEVKER